MQSTTPSKGRSSRWTREPALDNGKPVTVYPTERDIERFKLLTRYRYLPSDYIHAFVGGSLDALSRRLNFLSRRPNCYLARPHQQRANASANHRRLIYELDERGSRLLRDRGLPFLPKSYHRNFAHELMVAEVTASIELGARTSQHIQLITWPQILASISTPKTTRESDNPHAIPITFSVLDQHIKTHIVADARPFGLRRTLSNRDTFLFFPGIEADCASEPIVASDFERSSIYKKFAAYTAIADQSIYKSHFGFPNFFVPFISTSHARTQSMMALLEQVSEARGSKIFLFKTFPAFTSFEKRPSPTGCMLTEPWQRVGFSPFFLDR